MPADGSVLIDSKMNADGLTAGTEEIKDGLDRMSVALRNSNKEVLKFIEDYENGLTGASGYTNELHQMINKLESELKKLEGSGKWFGDDDYDKVYLQLEKARQAAKDYKKELLSPTPNANPFGLDTLSGKIIEAELELKKLAEAGKGIGDKEFDEAYRKLALLKAEAKAYTAELSKTPEQIQKELDKQAELEAKKEAAEKREAERLAAQEARAAAKQAKEEARIDAMNKKLEEARAKEVQAMMEADRLKAIGENAEISRQDIVELNNELAELEMRQKDLKAAGIGLGFEEFDSNTRRIAEINGALREYQKSLMQTEEAQKKAESSGKKMNKSLNNTEKGAKKASRGMEKMLVQSVVFSMVFRAISTLTNGMKEGMDNLAQYSGETNATLSSLKSSLTQLKNSFATAFSPILTAAAPALNYLIGLLITASTAVAHLIAVLTGKSTFVKASKVQQDYAKSLKGTAGAAEEAEGALASFDKLNVMQDKSSSGGSGEPLPSEMFETVAVDNALTQAIDNIKKKLTELSGLFKKGFKVGVGDLSVLDSIKESLSDIKNDLIEIFSDANVIDAFENMVDTLVYDAGRIAGAFVSMGLSIADNILGGFRNYLAQNKERIKKYLVSMFDITSSISTIKANFFVALSDIFSVFRSDTAKQITTDIIAIYMNAFMGITELIGKMFRDVLDLMLTPFTNNADAIREALENTLLPIEEVLGTLSDSITRIFDELNKMYDGHIAPMFDSFKEGLSEVLETFLDGYNTYMAPVLDRLAEKFTVVWEKTIQPIFDNAIGLIGDVADLINAVWTSILQPVINWIAKQIMPAVSPVIEGMGLKFLKVFDSIGTIFNTFLKSARAVIQFITGAFSGDWGDAWEGVKEKFRDIFESLPDIVKGVVNTVLSRIETMLNGAIKGINKFISGVNGVISNIPGVSDSAIPNIREISLPRLASGTVVPPRAGEFAAILGDNKRETEVVSPLSTMKQALKEALLEAGISMSSGDINGYVYLDGKELGQSIVKFVRQETKRTGNNPVLV